MESNGIDAAGFAQRLKQVVREYGSANSLAIAMGRSEGALRNWLTGKSEPTVSNIIALCRETRTDPNWLLTGRGERRLSGVNEVREPAGQYNVGGNGSFDEGLLRKIAETVEVQLSEAVHALTPAKRAQLIVDCYHFIGTQARFTPEAVARLVRLAV